MLAVIFHDGERGAVCNGFGLRSEALCYVIPLIVREVSIQASVRIATNLTIHDPYVVLTPKHPMMAKHNLR